MTYIDFLDQDITVHSEYGHTYRGILRAVHEADGLLEFEVGIDIFYIRAEGLFAITVHGISSTA